MLRLKENIKTLWFFIHKSGMYIIPYLWIISKNFLYLNLIIISSWILNNNKCLLTQIEYYIFRVKPGRIIFEIDGVSETVAREALLKMSSKLPFDVKFISRIEGN